MIPTPPSRSSAPESEDIKGPPPPRPAPGAHIIRAIPPPLPRPRHRRWCRHAWADTSQIRADAWTFLPGARRYLSDLRRPVYRLRPVGQSPLAQAEDQLILIAAAARDRPPYRAERPYPRPIPRPHP